MTAAIRWTEEQMAAYRKRIERVAPVLGKQIAETAARGGGRRKYRNEPVVDDEGIRHDSKKEAKRWKELRLMLRAGEIAWLARQVEFALPGKTVYRADFVYGVSLKVPGGGCTSYTHVEDVKSDATRKLAAYRIKVRLMKDAHGIEVEEI